MHRFPLLLFHNHHSLPVPIHGYHLQTLLTLPWLPYTYFNPSCCFPLPPSLPCPLNLTLQPFLPFPSSPLPLPFSSFPFLPSSFLLLCPLLSFSLCPPLLLYMPIICPHSCCIGLYCSISSYTGFAIWDDIYDVIVMHAARLYSCHAWHNNNSVILLGCSRFNQWWAV